MMIAKKAVATGLFQTRRNDRGQAVIVLLMFLATMIIGPVCFFSYEMSLYNLAKQQLKSCVDSAALAAGACQASSNNTSQMQTQLDAEQTAFNMFQMNTVLGNSLNGNTSMAASLPLAPAANKAQLFIQFLDPITMAPQPIGSSNAKIIQVYGSFGFSPVFAKFIGLTGTFPVTDVSNGALPQLDVVLCFDTSASMDDFTLVSIVNRSTGGTPSGTNKYNVLNQGPLYTAFGCTNPTGSPLNATFPQSLDGGGGAYGFKTGSSSERGTNNSAKAPNAADLSNFTDVVVNIDGTNTESSGITINGFSFPGGGGSKAVGVLVEASRGNLESITIATNAGVPYSSWGITPGPGWFNAYVTAAMSQRHPIGDAILAAQNFFTIMNNDCDVHFGLVAFNGATPYSNNVGTTPTSLSSSDLGTSTAIGNICDSTSDYTANAFPSDPLSPKPPNPGIDLNPIAGPAYSNYSQVSTSVGTLLAYGGTNISGALAAADQMLATTAQGGRNLARKGAARAIVLFTDGLPTETSFGGDPLADARAQATAANQDGLPIYCIGLCMTPTLQASQTAALTDQNTTPGSGGIAGISGNGAIFYQATSVSQLNLVFENVARALVQLVKS